MSRMPLDWPQRILHAQQAQATPARRDRSASSPLGRLSPEGACRHANRDLRSTVRIPCIQDLAASWSS